MFTVIGFVVLYFVIMERVKPGYFRSSISGTNWKRFILLGIAGYVVASFVLEIMNQQSMNAIINNLP